MNKAFYIAGIVFSVIFLFTCGFYVAEVDAARSYAYMSYYSDATFYESLSWGTSATLEAATVSLFFFLAFITIDLLGLIKVKTTTMKVMGIIGLSISGIFLLWDFAVLSSPSSLSFDEVGVGFMFYCLIMLAFTIVGLVQSAKYAKMQKNGGAAANGDILDS